MYKSNTKFVQEDRMPYEFCPPTTCYLNTLDYYYGFNGLHDK